MIQIGIVVGEKSGDILGADLIDALREKHHELKITGIGGEQLVKRGCQCLFPMEKLAVIGITEVVSSYFELLSMRNKIIKYFIDNPPDVFVGIDAPDFNLSLENKLHKAGVKTIHYVSPSIWAWREYRLKLISSAVDMMLVLFPFEVAYYKKRGIPVELVGHPMACKIGFKTNKMTARKKLNLPQQKTVIAIMPGSRPNELMRLLPIFIKTAIWCDQRMDNLHFVSNLIDQQAYQYFINETKNTLPELSVSAYINQSLDVMEAADVVLAASGTVTLEAMLLKRPMVVAYRISWLTHRILMMLVKAKYAALPNLLIGREIVPEFLQYDCQPALMGEALLKWLNDKNAVLELEHEFHKMHKILSHKSGDSIADVVLNVIKK